jgi:TolB protein
VIAKPREKDHAELRGQVYFPSRGATAVFDERYSVPEAHLHDESHRLADLLIGALTGQNGGFASHLGFAAGSVGLRRIFTMDADGHDARAVSLADRSAIAPAFGKGGELYYAAAPENDVFRIQTAAGALVPVPYQGSTYGIAFSRDHAQVAVSLGVGDSLVAHRRLAAVGRATCGRRGAAHRLNGEHPASPTVTARRAPLHG